MKKLTPFTFHLTPKRGFTLLEVTIAIFIVTMFIVTILTVQKVGLKNAYVASQRYQANIIAQGVIEQIKGNLATNWQSGVELPLNSLSTNIASPQTLNYDQVNYTVNIDYAASQLADFLSNYLNSNLYPSSSNYTAAENSNLEKIITVTVTWSSYGQTNTQTLRTALTDWQPRF